MSKNATKWVQCTAEEYSKLYKHDLLLYSYGTNPDGDDTLQMFGSLGDEEKELIKFHRSCAREQAHDKIKLDSKYYIATEWGED